MLSGFFGLSDASLPHLLFILFGARHKQVGYTGYFAPEVTLYLSALLSVCLSALFVQIRRFNSRWALNVTAAVVIVGMSALAITDVPALMVQKVVRVPGIYDFEAGRSAARH